MPPYAGYAGNARFVAHHPPSLLLVEETDDLSSNVFPPRLLVVHDTGRCGQDDIAELTRWQQLDNPLLEIAELDVVSWGDDTGLVQAAVELNDYLAIAVVVNFLVLADVACGDALVHAKRFV
jgi:hypothetical protein